MKPKLENLRILKKEKAEKRAIERERIDLAVSLNICPECGSPLIEERYEKYEKPFLFIFKGKKWDSRVICSTDKKHYEEKQNFNYYL